MSSSAQRGKRSPDEGHARVGSSAHAEGPKRRKLEEVKRDKFNDGMILPTLLTQLIKILDQYPADGQILRELIQNADDAGAKRIAFLYDKTSYGCKSLCHPDLKRYQGPALYSYNDATFQEEDWTGIRMLHNSVKADDVMKVGRFGLGFKSIFHLTDMPGILSGGQIGFIEPHERFFLTEPDIGHGRPTSCKSWALDEALEHETLRDQFQPFIIEHFGVYKDILKKEKHFNGTLFRFPLRMKHQDSKFSDNVYTDVNVMELLNSLQKEPEMNLLFLKNIECIEVYIKEKNGKVTKSFSTFVEKSCLRNVVEKRKNYIKSISQQSMQASVHTSYQMNITTENKTIQKSRWLITQYCAGGKDINTRLKSDFADLKLLPWVGVAFELREDTPAKKPSGQIFCFLPLPADVENGTHISPTGMYTHIHGYFAVDQNRRHLKAADGIEDKGTLWNTFLKTVVVSKAMQTFIDFAIKEKLDPKIIYRIFPDSRLVSPDWKCFLQEFYAGLADKEFFFTKQNEGQWIKMADATFCCQLLVDPKNKQLRDLFLKNGYNLVDLPNHIIESLKTYGEAITITSPKQMADLLKRQDCSVFNQKDRNHILEYLLSDNDFSHLLGITNILPMKNGGFKSLDNASGGQIYIDTAAICTVIPDVKSCFLDMEQLSRTVVDTLSSIPDNFNIKPYELYDFPTLLKNILPFKEGKIVTSTNLSRAQLDKIWKYIDANFSDSLFEFEGFHLIPTSENKIAVLDKAVPVIFSRENTLKLVLPEAIQLLLKQCNAIIAGEMTNKHCCLGDYVLPPTVHGVLTTIEKGQVSKCLDWLKKANRDVVDKIRKFLANRIEHCNDHVTTIKCLPIFPLVGKEFKCDTAEAISDCYLANVLQYPIYKSVVDCTDEATMKLAQLLKMNKLSDAAFLKNIVLPALRQGKYKEANIQIIMKEALRKFDILLAQDRSILKDFQDVQFVKNQKGELCAPCDLFDVQDKLLCDLFDQTDKLPYTRGNEKELIRKLKQIGLKGRDDVTGPDLMFVCRLVASGKNITYSARQVKAKAVFQFIHEQKQHFENLGPETISDICQCAWVPVLSKPPPKYPAGLKWRGSDREFCKPSEIYMTEYQYLNGSVGLFSSIDQKLLSNLIDLGMHNRPTVSDVLKQYDFMTKSLSNNSETLSFAVEKIYSFFHENLGDVSKELQQNPVPRVWNGKRFIDVDQVTIDKHPFPLEPYCSCIDESLKKFENLFIKFGVLGFNDVSLRSILIQISVRHSKIMSKDDQCRDLLTATNILNHLAVTGCCLELSDPVPILPSANNRWLDMHPLSNVCFGEDDSELDITTDDGDIYYLLHPNIPPKTAKALGIPHHNSILVDSDDMGFQEFGQEEPLTTRIKNLLGDYSDGLSVLKEIIQNADDAGASEVRFIYDERCHRNHREKLFYKGMSEIQGPALFAYNDASFKEKDFQSITKLGGGMKKQAKGKVGRFGLGFNAVYNLTDVPCFFSSGHFVVFDPHKTHLGSALRGSMPGVKINLSRQMKKVERFIDQYYPFQGIFGCDILNDPASFKGTLFRLSLRTKQQLESIPSDICNVPYSKEEVVGLFRLLEEAGSNLLLFTQNIKKVSLYHLDEISSPNQMKLQCTIARTAQSGSILEIASRCMSQNTTQNIAPLHDKCLVSIKIKKGIFFQTSYEKKIRWHIVNTVGLKQSFDLAVEDCKKDNEQSLALLPVGGVACPINEQGVPKPLESGQIFCFLPLPTQNELLLPVHVNGYFSLSPDRRHLYEQSSGDKIDARAQWNFAVMEDAITEAYLSLLVDITIKYPSIDNNEYYFLWPPMDSEPKTVISRIGQSLLEVICSKQSLRLMRSLNGYHSFQNCVFANIDILNSSICLSIQQAFEVLHQNREKHLICLPKSLLSNMMQHCENMQMISLRECFQNMLLPQLSKLDMDLQRKLILYGLQCTDLHDLLKKSECIPVCPDGTKFVRPDRLIEKLSPLKDLFDDDDCRFPYTSHLAEGDECSRYLKNLREIGMNYETLTWEDIIDRCKSVEHSTSVHKKKTRSDAIIKLINIKSIEVEGALDDVMQELTDIKFLPVMKKPKTYPLDWFASEHEFVSPRESYGSLQMGLIGSVCPIVADSSYCSSFRETFWQKEPSAFSVLGQLRIAVDLGKAKKNDKKVLTQLQKIFDKIYAHLNDHSNKLANILCNLRDMQCIFQDLRLYYPSDCCLKGDNCPPLFIKLDEFFQSSYDILCSELDIVERFSCDQLVAYLATIKDSSADIIKACGVTTALILAKELEATNYQINEDIVVYVPGDDGSMHPSGDLCFNNCPWIKVAPNKKFSHPAIPFANAERLGVKTIRESMLEDYSDAIGDPFGQSEPLTQRLNRLLTGYPLGKGVFYELLQNADDAGAEKIHFILDKRHHSTEKVFDKCWEPLQGPGLCVYNDRPFAQKDIEGIQRLGMGSKASDPTKTGQYGVGFNCTYHLTDTPIIYTDVVNEGKRLCIFDPLHKHVPGATQKKPGRLFKDIDTLKDTFPDVFKTFLPQLLKVDQATIFRFPLRTQPSEISSETLTVDAVEDLFQQFRQDGSKSLLFLNNLSDIKLSVIDESNKEKTIHHVKINNPGKEKQSRAKFKTMLLEAGTHISVGKPENINPQEVIYTLNINVGPHSESWYVCQAVGFSPAMICDDVASAFHRREIRLMPRGGVAIPTKTVLTNKGALFSMLPLPISSHLPVHVNGHFALSYENREQLHPYDRQGVLASWNKLLFEDPIVRSYLKLIGKLKEALQTKNMEKDLKYYSDMFPQPSSFEKDAYVKVLLESLYRNLADVKMKCLPTILPSKKGTKIVWFAPVSDNYHQQAYFDNLSLSYKNHQARHFNENKDRDIRDILRDSLQKVGFPLLVLPMSISRAFSKAGRCVPSLEPQHVLQFFKLYEEQSSQCKIRKINIKVADTPFKNSKTIHSLLSYCLSDEASPTPCLEHLPLLLTEDSILRKFDSHSPIYLSDFAELFPQECQKYLDKDFNFLLGGYINDSKYILDFTTVAMKQFLERFLPALNYTEQFEVRFEELVNDLPIPPERVEHWVSLLWRFLDRRCDQKDKNAIIRELHPVANWNIVPVICNKQRYLMMVKDIECILNLNIGSSSLVRNDLRKLPFMDVDKGILKYISCIECLRGTIDCPETVLKALKRLLKQGVDIEGNIGARGCSNLCSYLASNYDNITCVEQFIFAFQQLPLFQMKGGKWISINNHVGCTYMIDSSVPNIEIDVFTSNDTETVFFQKPFIDDVLRLYRAVGITEIAVTEFYIKFCLIKEHWQEMMTPEGRYCHLQYICDFLVTDKAKGTSEYQAIVEHLQNLAFLEDEEGNFYRASDLYDWQNKSFLLMGEQLVPKKYQKYDWISFLKTCGLIHKITVGKFESYAKMIAKASLTSEEQDLLTVKKAISLLQYLATNYESAFQFSINFLDKIKEIPFAPSYRVEHNLSKIAPQINATTDGKLNFVTLNGACVHTEALYVWTACPILHDDVDRALKIGRSNNYYLSLMNKLGINKAAPVNVVVSHLKKICKAITNGAKCTKQIKMVIYNIYQRLKKSIDEVEDTTLALLKSAHVFATDESLSNFVQARWLFLEGEGISKYLYKVPYDLGPYRNLIMKLGGTESPTVQQYADVLNEIYAVIHNDKCSDPNKVLAIVESINGIFKNDIKYKSTDSNVEKLILPTNVFGKDGMVGIILHDSTEVYYNDLHLEFDRLLQFPQPLLRKFPKEIYCTIDQIVNKLPCNLKPLLLSSVIKEVLAMPTESVDCSFPARLKERFASRTFAIVVQVLVFNWFQKENKDRRIDINDEAVQESIRECLTEMTNIKITSHDALQTVLLYNGEPLDKSSSAVSFYIQKQDSTLHLRICSTFRNDYSQLANRLSKYCKIFQLCKKSIWQDLLEKDLQYLVENIQADAEYLTPENVSCSPVLGQLIHQDEHMFLDYGFRPIQVDSYVAIEIYNPIDEYNQNEEAIYKVGIVKSIEESSELICNIKYRVEVDMEGTMEVLTRDRVYEFLHGDPEDRGVLKESEAHSDYVEEHRRLQNLEEMVQYAIGLPKTDIIKTRRILRRLAMNFFINPKISSDIDQNIQQCIQCGLRTLESQEEQNVQQKIKAFGDSVESSQPIEATRVHNESGGYIHAYLQQRAHVVMADRRAYQRACYESSCTSLNIKSTSREYYSTSAAKSSGALVRVFSIPKTHARFFGWNQTMTSTSITSYKNPQRGMARRWLLQAEHELTVIEDMDNFPNQAWDCVATIAYSSVERSLTAALYADDAERVRNMALRSLSSQLWSALPSDVYQAVQEAVRLNPGEREIGQDPTSRVSLHDAARLRDIAKQVLKWAQGFVENC